MAEMGCELTGVADPGRLNPPRPDAREPEQRRAGDSGRALHDGPPISKSPLLTRSANAIYTDLRVIYEHDLRE